MEIVNPTQNAPMLRPSSPNKRYLHSRSPSTSPTRPYSPLGFDPLLRCLSPTSTLQAFTTSPPAFRDSRSPSPRRLTLDASFKNVSEEQKELGCKAAQACLDIRGWTQELENWDWPGCFEEPEPARKRVRMSIMSIGSLASGRTVETIEDDEDKEEFWGSLPAAVVREYDQRVQEISTQLDEIDLEDLKNYTLQAHASSNESTPRLLQQGDGPATTSSPDMRQLDDFTAIVTATILQTLPYVNQLARLLDDWSARVAVLKEIPSFLKDLDRLRTDLDHGWAAVAVSLRKNGMYASLGSHNMQEMQTIVDSSMASLGQRLDGFLDALEGRQDTVPDVFLDKFEELEERYAEWVVMAQRRVLGDELKEYQAETSRTPKLSADGFHDGAITPTRLSRASIDRAKTPTVHDSEPVESTRPSLLPGVELIERARTPTYLDANDIVERAVTPTIRDASSAAPSTPDDEAYYDTHKSRILQEGELASQPKVQRALAGAAFTALPQIVSKEATLRPTTSHSVKSREISPTRSARHVPIMLPYDGDGTAYQPSPAASATNLQASPGADPSSTRDVSATRSSTVIPPDFPQPQSPPKQPKSPARQASNAIARLFKREKKQDADLAQNASTKSESGGFFSSRRSASRKRDTKIPDTLQWGGRPDSPASSSVRPGTSSSTTDKSSVERKSLQADRNLHPSCDSAQVERGRTRHEHEETLRRLEPAAEFKTSPADRPAKSVTNEPSRPKTAVQDDAIRPHTNQPNGLARPSTSPKETDFPENWPLPQAMRDSPAEQRASRATFLRDSTASESSEIDLRTVRSMAAIGSDTFDKMFIDEFPSVPNEHNTSGYIRFDDDDDALSDAATEIGQARTPDEVASVAETDEDISILTATPPSTKKLPVPTVTSSMLSSSGRQDDMSVARAMSIEGLRQFENPPSLPAQNHKERYMAVFKDDRASSLPVADDSSIADETPDDDASLHDASIGYFRVPPTAPAAIAAVTAATATSAKQPERQDTSNAAALAAVKAMMIHQQPGYPPPLPAMPESEEHFATSDESPTEVRDLKRASMASIKAHMASEVRSIDVPARRSQVRADATRESSESVTPAFESAPESRRDSSSYIQRPGYSRRGSRSGAQSPTGSIDTPNFSRLRSSSVDTNDQRPPLNATISKKRRTAPALETIQPSAEYDTESVATKTTQPAKRDVHVDEFDRHVSEVLEKIPAPIRFQARRDASGASSPGPRVSELKSQHRPRNTVMSRQASGSGGLTLTPAEVSTRKHDDSGIKLYHLTQIGREEPIKLFVRLVGENDRVMVRVGGGWADLADYLKQYAEHHGSRTVSGSGLGFELQSAGSTPAGSRRTSGAANTTAERRSAKDGIIPQNESMPTIEGRAELPGSDVEATLLSVNNKLRTEPARAKSALSTRNSNADLRKQRADAATPDHKATWVKTMLEKARKETSGAKSRKDNAFGEMGKMGSSRRVIFRSASAMDDRKSK